MDFYRFLNTDRIELRGHIPYHQFPLRTPGLPMARSLQPSDFLSFFKLRQIGVYGLGAPSKEGRDL